MTTVNVEHFLFCDRFLHSKKYIILMLFLVSYIGQTGMQLNKNFM